MLTHEEMVGLQREKHDLVEFERFNTKEEYVLHLIHQKAYEYAALLAGDKVVLDLGCNVGYGSFILSQRTNSVTGVDVSDRAINLARSKYGDKGIDFRIVDGSRLPFDDHTFDLICSFQVIVIFPRKSGHNEELVLI